MSDPFLILVQHMRAAQKACDTQSSRETLGKARYLEGLVDVAIQEELDKRPARSILDRLVADVEKV